MNHRSMQIILGVSSLKAYVTAPKSFHVLGIVRFGQEYGLLATNTDGIYFRVNGSQVAELNATAVELAMGHAMGRTKHHSHGHAVPADALAPPKVMIRKHRHAVQPLAH
jgi:hypothetical protein